MSIGLPEEESPLESLPSPGHAGILVVDEDPAFQLGLKTFLKEYVGFDQVFAARSGREALDLLESEESIDVITLDYQMPGMNGIEFMKQLSESAPRPLSVMMITGYPSEELESEFRSFSSPTLLADHFLHKPVEFEKLEPLVLKAHEELLAARAAADDAAAGAESTDTVGDLLEMDGTQPRSSKVIEATLFRQEAKIDNLTEKVKTLRRKARRDTILLGLLILAMGAAIHFGWFGKLETAWADIRQDFQQVFPQSGTDTPGETENSPAAPEPDSAPADRPL